MSLTAAAISAAFGAVASGLLAALVALLRGMRRDIRTFMAEHLWLIATANWSRTSIMTLMQELGINGPPPPEITRPRK